MNKRQRKKRMYALLKPAPVPSFFTDHLKWLMKRAAEKEKAPAGETGARKKGEVNTQKPL